MTPGFLRRSEARLAAEHLARAEAWVDQVAPELQADIARIRAQLLERADSPVEPGFRDPRPQAVVAPVLEHGAEVRTQLVAANSGH
jgi:hypothetical protein